MIGYIDKRWFKFHQWIKRFENRFNAFPFYRWQYFNRKQGLTIRLLDMLGHFHNRSQMYMRNTTFYKKNYDVPETTCSMGNRLRMDRANVNSSAYSSSPPKATPREIVVILTGKCFNFFVI